MSVMDSLLDRDMLGVRFFSQLDSKQRQFGDIKGERVDVGRGVIAKLVGFLRCCSPT
jgi:hypothetical protein